MSGQKRQLPRAKCFSKQIFLIVLLGYSKRQRKSGNPKFIRSFPKTSKAKGGLTVFGEIPVISVLTIVYNNIYLEFIVVKKSQCDCIG